MEVESRKCNIKIINNIRIGKEMSVVVVVCGLRFTFHFLFFPPKPCGASLGTKLS